MDTTTSRTSEDNSPHGNCALLDAITLKSLSEIRPLCSALHIATEWILIGISLAYGCTIAPPYAYPFLICFIGARQHALGILMHDGAHVRLFRHRALNDWVSEVLLTWPTLLFTMHAYRRNHWPHHRYTNAVGDPDWERKQTQQWRFPKSRGAIYAQLLSCVSGVGFLRFIVVVARLPRAEIKQDSESRAIKIGRSVFIIGLFALITLLHAWREFLLFWVLPFITWMQLAFHIRSIGEHFAIRGRSGVFARTRTTIPNWFDRVFLLPKNVGYHLEHHLFPSVPFYNLPTLHKILMLNAQYRQSAHVTHGCWNVLRECVPPTLPAMPSQ